jgi:hypothetical protein
MGKDRPETTSYWADMHWASEHLAELRQQFEDVWIAIVDQKVIAASSSLGKVKGDAARKTGRRPEEITVKFITSAGAIYGTG